MEKDNEHRRRLKDFIKHMNEMHENNANGEIVLSFRDGEIVKIKVVEIKNTYN